MARAVQLAERGLYTTDPNPRVGCVIIDAAGEVVGEGWHEYAGGPHAEVNALARAGERARGAAAYITLEPCRHHGRTPPCTQALIKAGVARVVAAMTDPNPKVAGRGIDELRAAGIAVECGVMSDRAQQLNPGFISRMRHGRPYVRCKVGFGVDGGTAMADGQSRWITSADSRRDVQRLRARSSAILTGIGTVLADDPALTVRPAEITGGYTPTGETGVRQPLRVVVDSHLRMPETARMLSEGGSVFVAAHIVDAGRRATLLDKGVTVECLPAQDGGVDLRALLARLAALGVNELLVEAGATLNGALLEAGLIDELVFYIAPKIMGGGARGVFHLPWLKRMEQCIALTFVDVRQVGPDIRLTARVEGR